MAEKKKPKGSVSNYKPSAIREEEPFQNNKKGRTIPSQLLKMLSGQEEEPLPPSMQKMGRYLALDCEMVGIGPPPYKESALARVSIVNFYGHTLLDVYVKPKERVGDFRTSVSGITPAHLKEKAVSFEKAQQLVSDITKNKILVGHALHNDEKVLLLSHPRKMTRDTASYRPFLNEHNGGRSHLSLRKLAKAELGITIQSGAHSSVEDAPWRSPLYLRVKDDWERSIKH